MFKYFILLLISPVYSQLSNIYFGANIIENKIVLDNNITIMFDLDKSNNNSMEYIYHDTEKITCYNDIYNISYEMNYDLYSSDYNYLNVSLDITNINHIILMFNEPFNYNEEYIINIKNYKIIFDYNSSIHNIGNHLYINFNNCNKNINKTIYNVIIRYIL